MDKPDYGKMPGNQEPNTPNVRESDEPGRYRHEHGERRQQQRRTERAHGEHREGQGEQRQPHERREPARGHHPDYGKIPGNQEPNTPDVYESEERRRTR